MSHTLQTLTTDAAWLTGAELTTLAHPKRCEEAVGLNSHGCSASMSAAEVLGSSETLQRSQPVGLKSHGCSASSSAAELTTSAHPKRLKVGNAAK